ncbi:MAG: substrate-binding domain-containing protein [Verrucomicrobiota bacterium JB023]|nr:substrate-binding domain-containing protein [Verrucomicrobiota bacterium JB023]
MKILSASEQVAAHLKRSIQEGQWSRYIPGAKRLASELNVNTKTVESALLILERDEIIINQGPGKRRLIMPTTTESSRQARVGILLYEQADRQVPYLIELQHALTKAGHSVIFGEKSLVQTKMRLSAIEKTVEQTPADIWLIVGGPRHVLEWFAERPEPSFAIFGRSSEVNIAGAGPDKAPCFAEATRKLIGLGHQRISLITRKLRRQPTPGLCERAFLAELAKHGLPTSDFNLPDWDESIEGLQGLLKSLFQVTPPTALIVDEVPFLITTLQFLASRGLKVPEDVSLVSNEFDPSFMWCKPTFAHVNWSSRRLVDSTLRWVDATTRGKQTRRQIRLQGEFIMGETIARAKGR